MEKLVSPEVTVAQAEGFRLSPRQRRIWRLLEETGPAPWRAVCAVALNGADDPAALETAVARVVARHEALRTRFPLPPGLRMPVQVIEDAATPSLLAPPAPAPAADMAAAFAAAVDDGGPVLAAAVAESTDAGRVLLLAAPSLCADAASLRLLAAELADAYAAAGGTGVTATGAAGDDEEPVQCADVAEWQNGLLEDEDTEGGRRHWRLDLSRVPQRLPFESADAGAFAPRSRPLPLADDEWRRLAAVAAELGVGEDAVLLAAWALFLERRAPGSLPALACVLDGRKFAELAAAVAPLACAVPVELAADVEAPFAAVVGGAAAALADAAGFSEFFSWDGVAAPPAEGSGEPWLPVAFESSTQGDDTAPAAPWRLLAAAAVGDRFTLKLRAALEAADGALTGALVLDYDAGRVSAETAAALADAFVPFLASLLEDPAQPAIRPGVLTAAEQRLVDAVARYRLPLPWKAPTLHGWIARAAAEHPDRTAVMGVAGARLTYGELVRQAGVLAAELRAAGVRRGQPVGVALERSPRYLVAVLAVLQASGAYLPLDPDYPADRLAFMLADSGAALLLTDRAHAAAFDGFAGRTVHVDEVDLDSVDVADDGAPPALEADDLAYVIYTSGSTGRPKGVAVSHRAAVNHMAWIADAFALGADDRVAQRTPLSFDASVWEVFAPLMAGSRLVLDAPGNRFDADALLHRLRSERVTVLQVVPSMLRLLVENPGFADLPALRLLASGGEALPRRLARQAAQATGARVINLYGPTEAAIDSTWHAVEPAAEGPVPIGRPIANAGARVLDAALRPLPPAAAGELWLTGDGLARGYLGRPATTAERFVPDPLADDPGSRMYRTGDLARLRGDGELEFIGRADHQVKLRGFRIELGEVEEVLAAHPGVGQAVATVRGDAGEQRLVAYWTALPSTAATAAAVPSVDELRAHLARALPEHMVPAAFVHLDELPKTPSGKVDRNDLPEPDHQRPELAQEYVAPRNFEEEVLCSIWAEVLDLDDVGVRDNFFALGADSIRSVRVVALARERGLDLSLQLFFQHQTIEELVAAMQRGSAQAAYLATEPFGLVSAADRERLPPGLEDAYPLSGLQHGMLFHMEVDPAAPAYHNVTGFHIRGPFHAAAFQQAVDRAVARHAVLRTSFDLQSYGEPLQLVHPQARIEVQVRDLRGRPAAEQEAATDALVEREKTTPFDLSRPPLLRFFVDRVEDDRYWFVLTECHSILDGWSLTSILHEIFHDHFRIADGLGPEEPPPLELAFRDYVALERRSRDSAESQEFWRQQLDGARLLRVPRRRTSFRAEGEDVAVANVPVRLGELGDRVLALARRLAVPVKSVCLAAHVKTLGLIAGENDVLTGLPTNGRPDHPDGERIRGLFINTVPFRLRLDRLPTWGELVREVFETERRLLAHRRYPLDAMRRNQKDEPLFEVLFSFVHFHHLERLLAAGRMTFLDDFKGWEANNFTLMVGFNRHPPDLDLKMRLYYNPLELSEQQVTSYGELLVQVFSAMTGDPESLHGDFDPRRLASADEEALLGASTRVDELADDFAF